mgnify:CR=1 FL=1
MCVQYLYVDQRKFANLSTEVFADQVDVDYTHLLGGAPYVTTGQKRQDGRLRWAGTPPRSME